MKTSVLTANCSWFTQVQ